MRLSTISTRLCGAGQAGGRSGGTPTLPRSVHWPTKPPVARLAPASYRRECGLGSVRLPATIARMPLRLCVLLWPKDGTELELRRYEDLVLPLLTEHEGRLISRETVCRTDDADPLCEIQVIEFTDQIALDGDMADRRRRALEDQRALAIEKTQILSLRV